MTLTDVLPELYDLQDLLPHGWLESLSGPEADYAISVWRHGIELVAFGLSRSAKKEIDRILEDLAADLAASEAAP